MNPNSTLPRQPVQVGPYTVGDGSLLIIAGPCVIESESLCWDVAGHLKQITQELNLPFVFKASFDKANRTSHESFRGPGLEKGLEILTAIRSGLSVPITTDVHEVEQVAPVASVVDLIQIPAFLCRQTDLLLEAGRKAKAVNIKKGQFADAGTLIHSAKKVQAGGCQNILLTERGTFFGYGDLVVDMRNLVWLREGGFPVIFDGTHSVQQPGARGSASGGRRELAPYLIRAAVATGVDGIFMEVHPDPDRALSDGPNMIPLSQVTPLLETFIDILSNVQTRHLVNDHQI
ncbi:MAG: 3-deoxy-8-phosphooctulonate synthase, partial [Armatimonadota bacterium]|nr:3-deoxy-8-phosphooctulonate synthase [Armatimonadota bacterium]